MESLLPYIPGEQPRDASFIKLNTNENPYGASPLALEAIRSAASDDLRLYPDPAGASLKRAIATRMNLTMDHVFIGNGSDEVLAHAFNAFFRGKGAVLLADIIYSFYRTYCSLYELPFRQIALDERFRCNPEDYCGACGVVVIANPNAPTGIAMSLRDIEQILLQNRDVVVLVDEAYVDFGAQSAIELVPTHENLLVTQTFSKSRSLAGLRVGFAVGQPHLIEALERIKNSFNCYPLGRLALEGAVAAWADQGWFDKTRRQVMVDRDRMTGRLRAQGFDVLPSSANFVCVTHNAILAGDLNAGLRLRGIVVRHFDQARIGNWLRISIGAQDQCDRLLEATESIVEACAGW